MADGLGTAGKVVSGVSPVLGVVPYVGPLLSAVGSLAGGLMQSAAAKKQAAQAAKIRKDALGTQTEPLRSEFLKKKRIDEMGYLSGLPAYELAKSDIKDTAASNLRAIRESSASGSSTVNAISAALAMGDKAQMGLDIKNAEYKAGKLGDVGNTEWAIGEKQRQLEDLRDQQKKEGLTAASAFENAATANKMNAVNTITGALGATAASIGKTAQNQQYMNMLTDIYGKDGATTPAAEADADTPLVADENSAMPPNGSTLDSPEAKAYAAKLKLQGFGSEAIRNYLLQQGYTE
jgi:hypothetical protein